MVVKAGKNEQRAADDAHRIAGRRRVARAEAERTQQEAHEHVRIAEAEIKAESEKAGEEKSEASATR